MVDALKPMRRVVTGHNAQGKSCVLYDSAALNVRADPARHGGGMIEFWCFASVPVDMSSNRDDGRPPFTHDPPQHGAFLRFVRSLRVPPGYDPAKDPDAIPLHEPIEDPVTGRGDKGGRQAGRSIVHRTRSVDYGFVAAGHRTLILDEQELPLAKGNFVIELGNYHAWSNPTDDSLMGYVMLGATYD
jgi:hypothetical protein